MQNVIRNVRWVHSTQAPKFMGHNHAIAAVLYSSGYQRGVPQRYNAEQFSPFNPILFFSYSNIAKHGVVRWEHFETFCDILRGKKSLIGLPGTKSVQKMGLSN